MSCKYKLRSVQGTYFVNFAEVFPLAFGRISAL